MKTKNIDLSSRRFRKLLANECDYWIIKNTKPFRKQVNRSIRRNDKQYINKMVMYGREY